MRYLVIIFVLLCAVYIGLDFGLFDRTERYRMTATIETPEGAKTGSGVWQLTIYKRFSFPDGFWSTAKLQGEAFPVDLGKSGVMFVLPTSANGRIVYDDDHTLGDMLAGKNKAVLPPASYPRLVHFRDPDYPQTIEDLIRFDDSKSSAAGDKFEESFGQGVKIKEITLERTSDPATGGVEKRLPWLPCIEPLRSIAAPLKTALLGVSDLTTDDFRQPPRADPSNAACKGYFEKWTAYEKEKFGADK